MKNNADMFLSANIDFCTNNRYNFLQKNQRIRINATKRYL